MNIVLKTKTNCVDEPACVVSVLQAYGIVVKMNSMELILCRGFNI